MSLSFNKISGPLKTGAPTQSPRKTPSLGEFLQPPPQPPSQAHSYRHPDGHDDGGGNNRWQHLYVLPVLLLEFLALALTRAALPSMLVNQYGDSVYVVMGMADCIRGLLAFVACPLFGKISDMIGRRVCLFITVMGTLAPVSSLALFPWEVRLSNTTIGEGGEFYGEGLATTTQESTSLEPDDSSDSGGIWTILLGSASSSSLGSNDDAITLEEVLHPSALPTFILLLALSGIFSSTFTLVFAYISDTVRQQEERVAAYGLALATFGLSFTIGPIVGGYLARSHKQYVFLGSLILAIVDLVYIYAVLPESRPPQTQSSTAHESMAKSHISWNPVNTIRLIALDPFLRKVSKVAFLYYTALWAVISTFSVYAVKRFHLGPERLGELMSALGLCTMVAEAALVRIFVPLLGEKRSIKIGLISFAIQCGVLGFAFEPWHLFVCAFFSLLGNLVYPSLSSLVSGSVEPEAVGEALGAVNGIKALTEGIGPLLFGSLMTLSENTALPGWPYLLAGVLGVAAYYSTEALPDPEDDNNEFIHELERKRFHGSSLTGLAGRQKRNTTSSPTETSTSTHIAYGLRNFFSSSRGKRGGKEEDVELEGLLSDIDDDSDGDESE